MSWRRVFVLPKQVPSEMQKLERNVREAVRQGMVETAMYSIGVIARTINRTTPYKPVATNTYRQAWTWKKTKTGAIVGNPTIQSISVEVGRRPGKSPPFKAILEWVRVKKLVKGADVKKALGIVSKKRKKRTKPAKPKAPRPKPTGDESLSQSQAKERAKAKSAATRKKRKAALAAKKADMEEAIAWAVVRKIRKKGIKEREVLLRSLPAIAKFSKREVQHQIRNALGKQ